MSLSLVVKYWYFIYTTHYLQLRISCEEGYSCSTDKYASFYLSLLLGSSHNKEGKVEEGVEEDIVTETFFLGFVSATILSIGASSPSSSLDFFVS